VATIAGETGGPALTAREREVLQFLAEGLSAKETGHRLNISPKTVESHRRNMMAKTGFYSIAELTKFALREGITFLER
jgi:DNA-binding NarL/FixJ family response regulator